MLPAGVMAVIFLVAAIGAGILSSGEKDDEAERVCLALLAVIFGLAALVFFYFAFGRI